MAMKTTRSSRNPAFYGLLWGSLPTATEINHHWCVEKVVLLRLVTKRDNARQCAAVPHGNQLGRLTLRESAGEDHVHRHTCQSRVVKPKGRTL